MKRAISPVIATVIIVSVAIAIAVAVAFWMTGITGLFTRYEKLEVISAYATKSKPSGIPDTINEDFYVVLTIRNTGTTDTTIDEIFVNGKPLSTYTSSTFTYSDESNTASASPTNTGTTSSIELSLHTGKYRVIVLCLDDEDGFTSGQTVEVKIHTAAGNEYPKSVQLP